MKYRVVGQVTISVHVDVEAKNPKEAKALAQEAGMQHLCHACSTGDEGTWCTSGELDGEPEITGVERIR